MLLPGMQRKVQEDLWQGLTCKRRLGRSDMEGVYRIQI